VIEQIYSVIEYYLLLEEYAPRADEVGAQKHSTILVLLPPFIIPHLSFLIFHSSFPPSSVVSLQPIASFSHF
jgi:hypothetical protein